MTSQKKKFQTVDEYIDTFPKNVQVKLKKLRQIIRKEIPGHTEVISYQIPAYKKDGKYIIYFAGWKDHLALYPLHRGVESLKKELAHYKGSKSSVHFPLDEPLPVILIRKIVKLRVKEGAKQ